MQSECDGRDASQGLRGPTFAGPAGVDTARWKPRQIPGMKYKKCTQGKDYE